MKKLYMVTKFQYWDKILITKTLKKTEGLFIELLFFYFTTTEQFSNLHERHKKIK